MSYDPILISIILLRSYYLRKF